MRFPLIAVLVVLAVALCADWMIWRLLRSKHPKAARIHAIAAAILNTALLVLICIPKRSGDEASFDLIVSLLYTYFTIYIPKFVALIFVGLASIPRLFGRKRRSRIVMWTGIALSCVIFMAMIGGALIGRYLIDVREVTVNIDDLPESFDSYRIAQISDLHVGSYGNDTAFISRLVDSVLATKPEMIVFTGDIVNRRSDELIPFVRPLSRLNAKDGVYSIMGNHDYGDYYNWPDSDAKSANIDSLRSMIRRMGWISLDNSHRFIYRSGDSIALIGVENVGDPPFRTYGDLSAAYPRGLDDTTVKILLSHNPAHWHNDIASVDSASIDLTLSGHTHAMQICVGGWSPAALRYPEWGGLYADSLGRQLYVNIGTGTVAIPSRIGADPEITVITLRKP